MGGISPQLFKEAATDVSQAKDSARNQLTQLVGKLVENSGSQNTDIVAALDAITAAINAKPSA